ncbi:MAG TPA: hypothetical protein VH184_14485 [Dongiaceae bacterium]|jgi:hypothetical protein|nr:hypothetical protein [Dongiaceae bacterium]
MISSKQFLRPLVLAAVLGAVFAVLPTAVDHGGLFGVGAAWAEGHSGSHGGTTDHDTAHGAPRNGSTQGGGANESGTSDGSQRNGGTDAALAGGSTTHDISQGVDNDRARDRVECAWYDCH